MLPDPVPQNLRNLTPKELETIYWQARDHDGCYKSVTLLQHFFDLYPANTPLRVRTSASEEYTTTISVRVILELKLIQPKLLTVTCVLPDNQTYITGGQTVMDHSVMGFSKSAEGNLDIVLDLASLQFGDLGRGLGGRSTFALESLDKFYDRVETIAMTADTDNARTSSRIGPCPDDPWLKKVAKRVKERWDQRDSQPWCGHCGAPVKAVKKCSVCKKACYCDAAHQVAAWPFHKRFCSAAKA